MEKQGKKQKGAAIYLALVIMTILLGMVLGLSAILIGQIKTVAGIGDSVTAFYAAETGIEESLFNDGDESYSASGILNLGSGGQANYNVQGTSPGGDADCPNTGDVNFCIKSIGIYQKTKRAIMIAR
ncbi:MAG: pilus assembly PilX N-terminal domain-containing protein [Candidatus Pacebacteria bacterium]|nr:pilus assembly PilX N-terminal domain-containing protein [Candidatus Paceibacterota bacterium]